MTDFKGKRIEDGELPANPGEYSKHRISGLDKDVWLMMSPNGGGKFIIGQPNENGKCHYVEENDDGTITVRPNPPADPENSNSIEVFANSQTRYYHGYIYNGIWRS